jgi:hypothetical protein
MLERLFIVSASRRPGTPKRTENGRYFCPNWLLLLYAALRANMARSIVHIREAFMLLTQKTQVFFPVRYK